MDNMCPFFKEECHGNQCTMWNDEECLIVRFLKGFQTTEQDSAPPDGANMTEKATQWLKNETPETLAKQMLEFKDEEFPKDEDVQFHTLSHLFWTNKGIDAYFLPSDVQLKKEQANIIAQRRFEKEKEEKQRARLAYEKEELPSLVGQCIDWARVNGLNKITLSDVDTFVMEKELDILYETKRALYSMANLKLKTGKQR